MRKDMNSRRLRVKSFFAVIPFLCYGAAAGCLIVAVYLFPYVIIAGHNVLTLLPKQDHLLPADLSDTEQEIFEAAIANGPARVMVPAIHLAATACLLLLVGAFCRAWLHLLEPTWLADAIDRTALHRFLLICAMLSIAVAGIILVHRSSLVPNPADFALTFAREQLGPPHPGLSLFEQFLFEADPDGDLPADENPRLDQALGDLQADPAGVRDEALPLLKPGKVLKSSVAAAHLLVDPGNQTIFLLNAACGRVQAIDIATQTVLPHSAELSPTTAGLCFSPDGNTLYATSPKDRSHSPAPGYTLGTGATLTQLSAEDLSVIEAVELPFSAYDVTCNPAGMLYVANGLTSGQNIYLYDPNARQLRGTVELRHRSGSSRRRLTYVPHRDLLYASPDAEPFAFEVRKLVSRITQPNFGVRPDDVYSLGEGEPSPNEAAPYEVRRHRIRALGRGDFVLSPNGKYCVFRGQTRIERNVGYCDGLALAVDSVDKVRRVASLPAHHALAWDEERKLLFVAYTDGGGDVYARLRDVVARLSIYSLPDFKLVKTYQLTRPAYELVWDGARKQLFAALDADKDIQLRIENVSMRQMGGNSPHASLAWFRAGNRATGHSQGPLCVYDLSGEVD